MGQIDISSSDVSSFSTASEGDFYLTETDELYIGLSSGALKPVGIVTKKGSEDGEVLAWNESNGSWESQAPSTGALTLEKSTIRTIDRARVPLNPTSNINTGSFTLEPSSFELNETAANIIGTNLTGLEGKIRFIVQPYLSSSSARTNFICNFLVNGTPNKSLAGALYARLESNHNETGSSFIFEYDNALTTDVFSFNLEREANTSGSVALISNGVNRSYIFVEQYTELDVVTNVTAPVDLAIAQGPTGPTGPAGPVGPAGPPISSPTDVYHATGNVRADGIFNYIQGASVIQNNVGIYTVTFDNPHSNGASYPVLFSMEQNAGEDDFVPSYVIIDASSFRVEITEQDNGATAGVPRNAGFSFYVPL